MINIHANNEFEFGGKDSNITSKEAGKEKNFINEFHFSRIHRIH
jgi:hypothetical protein